MEITLDAPPHGGTWIKTEAGFIEIRVFEAGVPPQFRLYFFAPEKRPTALPYDTAVTLETLRPSGARQTFSFLDKGEFLQSQRDIPEPHEFTVILHLSHGGRTYDYETTFTEEAHGHSHEVGDHAHGHSHSEHGHNHGPGGGSRRKELRGIASLSTVRDG